MIGIYIVSETTRAPPPHTHQPPSRNATLYTAFYILYLSDGRHLQTGSFNQARVDLVYQVGVTGNILERGEKTSKEKYVKEEQI